MVGSVSLRARAAARATRATFSRRQRASRGPAGGRRKRDPRSGSAANRCLQTQHPRCAAKTQASCFKGTQQKKNTARRGAPRAQKRKNKKKKKRGFSPSPDSQLLLLLSLRDTNSGPDSVCTISGFSFSSFFRRSLHSLPQPAQPAATADALGHAGGRVQHRRG